MRASAFLAAIFVALVAAAPEQTMEKLNERQQCVRLLS